MMTFKQNNWSIELFKVSVMKQQKYHQLESLLGDTNGKVCLDIGGDNGVISSLLRKNGGEWHSADLDQKAVKSIKQLVKKRVYKIDGRSLPFHDKTFDVVVIIDFLEHIVTDGEFIGEVKRVLKPGGVLIVNVPNFKPNSVLNSLRNGIGLTDEQHGHVRPGYSKISLIKLLGTDFNIQSCRTYSKTFSEIIDTLLNFLYLILSKMKKQNIENKKGTLLSASDIQRNEKELVILKLFYPFLLIFSKFDHLFFMQEGYRLVVKASLEKKV
ncbi:MAG: class I SAM-dependent methyltransferase [Candidatus Hodarchaeales archaeon]|jgi:ubiquinone/menaquinone biosynthesis C-methylase UbiE